MEAVIQVLLPANTFPQTEGVFAHTLQLLCMQMCECHLFIVLL